ncbi:hypothetical protein L0F51_00235 [Afifella sp. H1R]|uniref:hypothetical protein n=1 Tax=Afifella sp. H1R TaxID=2908841 RepID=UPI001F490DE1|nr:hypothetical protein [Afifella sp. H1R]MCF1502192.1 hypothetical protein [Afifella sp. H1R]
MDIGEINSRLHGPARVKVGLPAGNSPGAVLDRAFWNEFGTARIPERPALRNAMRANRGKYQSGMRKGAKMILNGSASMRTILSQLGIKAQDDMKAEIVSLDSPPNAPCTVQQKESRNPLIDTGEYRQSITWKIDE